MININDTIHYIKRKLGYPSVSIELTDEDIVDIIKHESLLLFEKYVPDIGRRVISKGSKKFRVKKNLYWVIDPLDREVFYVQSVYPEEAEMLANGYPYTVPIRTYDSLPDVLDSTMKAHTSYKWGRSLHWWQESGINQVWIFSEDGISSRYSVSYTRSHAPDLSSINREYAMDFTNICLANTMQTIGQIRSKYSNFGTPVGDIPLNGSDLVSQGETLLNTTIENLKAISPIYDGEFVIGMGG